MLSRKRRESVGPAHQRKTFFPLPRTLYSRGGGNALHGLVYGLEYEHVFFRQNWIALAVDYGLLFKLILEGGRQGYAFGHQTRLGVGPVFSLGEKDQLLVNVAYNMVTFPYFELASTQMSYLSLALRYQRRFSLQQPV